MLYPMQPQLTPQQKSLKVWAIVMLAGGYALGVVGVILLSVGIGLCIIPIAFLAEVAGFICLCLI